MAASKVAIWSTPQDEERLAKKQEEPATPSVQLPLEPEPVLLEPPPTPDQEKFRAFLAQENMPVDPAQGMRPWTEEDLQDFPQEDRRVLPGAPEIGVPLPNPPVIPPERNNIALTPQEQQAKFREATGFVPPPQTMPTEAFPPALPEHIPPGAGQAAPVEGPVRDPGSTAPDMTYPHFVGAPRDYPAGEHPPFESASPSANIEFSPEQKDVVKTVPYPARPPQVSDVQRPEVPPQGRHNVPGIAPERANIAYSHYDHLWKKYAPDLANDSEFIRTVSAAAKAESGFNPNRINSKGEYSVGLFQMNMKGGAGTGYSEQQLKDPELQARVMVPQFAAKYREFYGKGLRGEELASAVARYTERPEGYKDPNGVAAQNYKRAYAEVAGGNYQPGPGKSYVNENRVKDLGTELAGIPKAVQSKDNLLKGVPVLGGLFDLIGNIPVLGGAIRGASAASDIPTRALAQQFANIAGTLYLAQSSDPMLKLVYEQQGPDAAFNHYWENLLAGEPNPAKRAVIEKIKGLGEQSFSIIPSIILGAPGVVSRLPSVGKAALTALDVATAGPLAPVALAQDLATFGRGAKFAPVEEGVDPSFYRTPTGGVGAAIEGESPMQALLNRIDAGENKEKLRPEIERALTDAGITYSRSRTPTSDLVEFMRKEINPGAGADLGAEIESANKALINAYNNAEDILSPLRKAIDVRKRAGQDTSSLLRFAEKYQEGTANTNDLNAAMRSVAAEEELKPTGRGLSEPQTVPAGGGRPPRPPRPPRAPVAAAPEPEPEIPGLRETAEAAEAGEPVMRQGAERAREAGRTQPPRNIDNPQHQEHIEAQRRMAREYKTFTTREDVLAEIESLRGHDVEDFERFVDRQPESARPWWTRVAREVLGKEHRESRIRGDEVTNFKQRLRTAWDEEDLVRGEGGGADIEEALRAIRDRPEGQTPQDRWDDLVNKKGPKDEKAREDARQKVIDEDSGGGGKPPEEPKKPKRDRDKRTDEQKESKYYFKNGNFNWRLWDKDFKRLSEAPRPEHLRGRDVPLSPEEGDVQGKLDWGAAEGGRDIPEGEPPHDYWRYERGGELVREGGEPVTRPGERERVGKDMTPMEAIEAGQKTFRDEEGREIFDREALHSFGDITVRDISSETLTSAEDISVLRMRFDDDPENPLPLPVQRVHDDLITAYAADDDDAILAARARLGEAAITAGIELRKPLRNDPSLKGLSPAERRLKTRDPAYQGSALRFMGILRTVAGLKQVQRYEQQLTDVSEMIDGARASLLKNGLEPNDDSLRSELRDIAREVERELDREFSIRLLDPKTKQRDVRNYNRRLDVSTAQHAIRTINLALAESASSPLSQEGVTATLHALSETAIDIGKVGSYFSQAVNVARILNQLRGSPTKAGIKTWMERYAINEPDLVAEIKVTDFLDDRSVEGLDRIMHRNKDTSSRIGAYLDFRGASLLSGMSTGIINALGPAPLVPYGFSRRVLTSRAGGATWTEALDDAVSEIQYLAAGIGGAFETMVKTLNSGISEGHIRDIGRRQAGIVPGTPQRAWRSIKDNPARAVLVPAELVYRTMAAVDDAWRKLYFQSLLKTEAKVYARSNNLRTSEVLANLVDYPDVFDRARKESLRRVFQEPLEGKLAAIDNLRNKFGGAGRVLVPFLTTTLNIMKIGTEVSPVGAFRLKNATDPIERAQIIADAQIGSFMWAGFAIGATVDNLTGFGPPAGKDREAWLEEHAPFSARVGDKWVPLELFGPAGVAAGFVATFMDGVRFGRLKFEEDKKLDEAVAEGFGTWLQGAGRFVLTTAGLRGLNDLYSALFLGQDARLFEGIGLSMLTPYGGFARSINTAVDPSSRDPDSFWDAFRMTYGLQDSSIPWWGIEPVAERKTRWGEDVQRIGGPIALSPLAPLTRARPYRTDPVRTEVTRLQRAGYDAAPGFVDGKMTPIKGVQVELTSSEKSLYQEVAGQMAQERIQRLIATSGWSSLPDAYKAKVISTTIQQVREYARRVVMYQRPAIKARAVEERQEQLAKLLR